MSEFVQYVLFGVLLHEVAHCIDGRYVETLQSGILTEYVEPVQAFDRANFVRSLQEGPPAAPEFAAAVERSFLAAHGANWLRTCLHLRWRWRQATDQDINAFLIADMNQYGMIGVDGFADALEDANEYSHFVNLTFDEIADEPIPAAFAQEWFEQNAIMRAARAERRRQITLPVDSPVAVGVVPVPAADSSEAVEEDVSMSAIAIFVQGLADEVRGIFRKEDDDAADAFTQLVRDTTAGKKVKAEDAAKILREAGKTPDDLRLAVERILKRKQDRKIIDDAIGIDQERQKLAAREAEATHKRERAELEFETVIMDIAGQERQLSAKERAASDAKVRQEQSADPAKKITLQEAQQVHGKATEALHFAQTRLPELRDYIRHSRLSVTAAAAVYKPGAGGHSLAPDGRGLTADWQRANEANMTLDEFNSAIVRFKAAEKEKQELEDLLPKLEKEVASTAAIVEQCRAALLAD